MKKVAIIADDLTGALDCAVKTCGNGRRVHVYPYIPMEDCVADCDVISINTDSRHINPEQAYKTCASAVSFCVRNGFSVIFKKTDSGLRGNIGQELDAAMDATKRQTTFFLPALPEQGRMTIDGIHYVNGIILSESIFGIDPLNPMKESCIPSILAFQSKRKIVSMKVGDELGADNKEKILVLDAKTDADVSLWSCKTKIFQQDAVYAGSAAFAGALFSSGHQYDIDDLNGTILLVSGSRNPVSFRQIHQLQKFFPVKELDEEELTRGFEKAAIQTITSDLEANHCYTISVPLKNCGENINAEQSAAVVDTLSRDTLSILNASKNLQCVLIVGGDTLQAFIKACNVEFIRPMGEVEKGIVYSKLQLSDGRIINLISKSGAFGSDDTLLRIVEIALKEENI